MISSDWAHIWSLDNKLYSLLLMSLPSNSWTKPLLLWIPPMSKVSSTCEVKSSRYMVNWRISDCLVRFRFIGYKDMNLVRMLLLSNRTAFLLTTSSLLLRLDQTQPLLDLKLVPDLELVWSMLTSEAGLPEVGDA